MENIAMGMREHVESEIKAIKDTYLTHKRRVAHDYHGEIDYQESYHGRELLELLQNADDEMKGAKRPKVQIKFDGITLTVSNNGRPFSKDGVSSLMVSNVSPKRSQRELIGNMGTGFRSILGWSEIIKIHSGDLHIRFTYEHSQEELRKIYPNSKKSGMVAATLVFPEWIDDDSSKEYTTEISIKTSGDKKVRKDIIGQINKLNGEILLFLNNTNELELIFENTKRTFIRRFVGENIIIEKYENSVLIEKKEWYVKKSEDNRYKGKFYSVTLAYDISGDPPANKVLYAYFPTQVEFPFNVLLHADFDVNIDRRGIKSNEENREIFKTAAQLLVDFAIELFEGDVSYNPLILLNYKNLPSVLVEDFSFDKLLHDAISKAKIFPTLKGKYECLNDTIKYYRGNIADFVSGEAFDNLMPFCPDADLRSLINSLFDEHKIDPHYENEELETAINSWVKSLPKNDETIITVVECLSAIKSDYGCHLIDYRGKLNLKLEILFDCDFNIIPYGKQVFLRGENSISIDIPSYMNVSFLHPIMDEYIKKSEDLSDALQSFNIRVFDFSDMVDASNEILIQKNKIELCYEELLWIWKYQDLIGGQEISIILPNRSNKLMFTNNMFMGKEYRNDIEERIISCIYEDSFVVDIKDVLPISNSEAKDLLKKLGVKRFPQIKTISLNCSEWGDKQYFFHSQLRGNYTAALFNCFSYPISKEGFTFDSAKELSKRFYSLTANVSDIDNLESVLSKVKTADVLYWIRNDEALRKVLFNKYERSVNTISIRWVGNYNRALGDKIIEVNVLSPIYWLFSCIPWLEVNGKRYCIGDCLLDLDDTVDLSPCLVKPAVDDYISELSGKTKKNKADCLSLLSNIGIQDHFSDLSVEKIYETLNYLPNVEKSGILAKRFYVELLDEDTRKRIQDYVKNNEVEQFKHFVSSGSVFCHNGEYASVKKACYVSKKGICSTLLESLDIIAVTGRIAYSAIPSLFGVKELLLKGMTLYDFKLNAGYSQFVEDFNKFRPLAFAYRVNSKKDPRSQARKFLNLNVLLCSEVTIKYNDKYYSLSDGDFYYEAPNTFYLCSSETFKPDGKDIKLSIGISSIICSHLDIAENKSEFQGLYAANSTKDRMTILNDTFDVEIINRAKKLMNSDEDVEDSFIKTIDKLTDKDITKFNKLIDDIDFENIYAESNCVTIIKLFRRLGIDIEDFNSKSDYQLDVTSYYKKKTEGTLPNYRNYYKTTKYVNYMNASIEDKKNLQKEFIKFETDRNAIIYRNSVYYDYEKEIVKQLSIDMNLKTIDFNSLFQDNKAELKTRIEDSSLLDEFLDDTENASLLYYGEFDLLVNLYTEYLVSKSPEPDEPEVPKPEELKPINYANIKLRPHTTQGGSKASTKGTSKVTSTGFKSNTTTNTKYGRDGERYVYYELLKDEKKKNVIWKSENGKKEGVYPEGSNKYGYDLEYVDETGNLCFVEVKTSTSTLDEGVSFHLTASEYNFGQLNSDNYFVYYVSDIKGRPTILVIDNLFVNGEFNEEVFAKQPESYIVSADEDGTVTNNC